jgi:predicted nucleotide-binding protein
MATRRPPELKTANISPKQMSAALPKLDRRIAELEAFDVATIQRRFDPLIDSLQTKVESTLQEILGHDTVEYNQHAVGSFDTLPLTMFAGHEEPLQRIQEGYREGIHSCVLNLKTLRELFVERISDAQDQVPTPAVAKHNSKTSRRVFVVHGHDSAAKESVARYLSKLDLEPIVLHEQPNAGRTIIEKFEAHSDVAFAVVLLTPDDVGYPSGKSSAAMPRARQNVILELGFFTAALGRSRVCALYISGVEIPSDFSGVLYHELDKAGAWRFLLARELKAGGLEVDLNRAL